MDALSDLQSPSYSDTKLCFPSLLPLSSTSYSRPDSPTITTGAIFHFKAAAHIMPIVMDAKGLTFLTVLCRVRTSPSSDALFLDPRSPWQFLPPLAVRAQHTGKEHTHQSPLPGPSATDCVTLGRLLTLSEPQLP